MTRDTPLIGFHFSNEVSDTGTELAEDRTKLLLPPTAQGLDRHAPAGCEFVLVKGDARGTVRKGPEKFPAWLNRWDLVLRLEHSFR